MKITRLAIQLFMNAFHDSKSAEDATKSITLSILIVVQHGLTWMLKKVNNMIGHLMSSTAQ